MEETKIYDLTEIDEGLTKKLIKEIYETLEEKGYNATNQIVGYLMSGDPGYITNYKSARNKILSLERSKILEILIKEIIK